MKVGRGLFGLMSKSNRKRTSRRHSPFLCVFALLVLGSTLILTGCGELSLNQLLENQEPGELRITPNTATLDANAEIEIVGIGGFKPYSFSASEGSFYEMDGTTYYRAPGSATIVTVTVVDRFLSEATATFEIVSSTSLSFPSAMTIEIGQNTGYVVATGGNPPYTFWLVGDGTLEFHDVLDDRVKYHADVSDETIVEVWVEDSSTPTPEQRKLTVTVVEELDD